MNPQEPRQTPLETDRRLQPDPELNLSGGRARGSQILWVGIAAVAIVVLLIFGLSNRGDDQTATNAPQQTVPPATSTADQTNARDRVSRDPGSGAENIGRTDSTTQRSSDVDGVAAGSTRNSGSGDVSPPRR